MKRVLIVKLSSLGDIVHSFAAINDIKSNGYHVDFLCDKVFVETAKLCSDIDNVFTVNIKKRQNNFAKTIIKEIKNLRKTLPNYDAIIDMQGLIKSAMLARFIGKGRVFGFDRKQIKEPLATVLYHSTISVEKIHIIDILRELSAKILNYKLPDKLKQNVKIIADNPIKPDNYAILLHGTTWKTKRYSLESWQKISDFLKSINLNPMAFWHTQEEKEFAEKIGCQIIDKTSIDKITKILSDAKLVIGLDTGLGHITAALGTPAISLYGSTDSNLIGYRGDNQVYINSSFKNAPCYKRTCKNGTCCMDAITPQMVINEIKKLHH